jgi:hypothetical protein
MKYITILLLVAMSACNSNQSKTIEEYSPNKKVHVTLSATKTMIGEPWECQLKVKAYSFEEGLLKFEISADELNGENVHFNWEPNGNCKIEITQRDKDIRIFQLIANEQELQLAEVSH